MTIVVTFSFALVKTMVSPQSAFYTDRFLKSIFDTNKRETM